MRDSLGIVRVQAHSLKAGLATIGVNIGVGWDYFSFGDEKVSSKVATVHLTPHQLDSATLLRSPR